MELKTKFSVGDFASSRSREYMGKVTRVITEQWVENGETKTKIVYTIRANGNGYNHSESDLIGIKFEGENDGIPNQAG